MTPRVPPVGLALLAFGAQVAVGAKRDATRTSVVLAAGMGLASAGLIAGSVAEFRRRNTTVNPVSPDATALVTTGPNRLTRNPMYVGMAGILAAHAVMRRAPASLLPAALFVVAIDRWQIPAEEVALRERFSADYETYASMTPRWLGPTVTWPARGGNSVRVGRTRLPRTRVENLPREPRRSVEWVAGPRQFDRTQQTALGVGTSWSSASACHCLGH